MYSWAGPTIILAGATATQISAWQCAPRWFRKPRVRHRRPAPVSIVDVRRIRHAIGRA
jgi:hypothetical protein